MGRAGWSTSQHPTGPIAAPVPAPSRTGLRHSAAPGTALDPLLANLRELRRRNEEFAGQVGFWQGRYQEAQATMKLLPVTVPDPVDTPETLPAPSARLWGRFRRVWRST